MIKKIPSLSFCITCMNRLHQIRNTLRKNLDDNRNHKHLVEFILLDLGSRDGLRDWIRDNFMDDIDSGALKYYYTDKLKSWNAPIAKNTAHLLGNNDILVNLDCDNFTGPNGGAFVINHFLDFSDDIVLHQAYEFIHGSFGRIAMRREFFHAVGGHDETFKPMLYEDIDLINRMIAQGLKYVHAPDEEYNRVISHEREESFANIDHPVESMDLIRSNEAISEAKITDGRLIANKNRVWGIRYDLFDIHNNPITIER